MKKLLTSALLLAAFTTVPAFAKTYKLPKANPIAEITFPDENWEVTVEDESIDASTKDDEISINIEVDDAESIEGAVQETMGYLLKNKVKVDKATEKKTEAKLNGMDVVDISWDGKDADGPAKISLTIVAASEKKVLLMLYWASPEGEKKYQKELDAILQSLKKK